LGQQLIFFDEGDMDTLKDLQFFSLEDENLLWSEERMAYTGYLEKIVYRITRKPRNLICHLKRIYYCFNASLNDELFAALIDFLVVLDRRGQAISWRMIIGSRSRLNNKQFKMLKDFLKDNNANANLLIGNQYSVFARGFLGTDDLIRQIEAQNNHDYDILEIVRDYIEYSQLEEAKDVLESAVFQDLTRIDLQEELLSLYKSTRDETRFRTKLTELLQMDVKLSGEWDKLNTFFIGLKNNG